MKENGIEKLLRDASIWLHSDGTNILMRMKLMNDLRAGPDGPDLWDQIPAVDLSHQRAGMTVDAQHDAPARFRCALDATHEGVPRRNGCARSVRGLGLRRLRPRVRGHGHPLDLPVLLHPHRAIPCGYEDRNLASSVAAPASTSLRALRLIQSRTSSESGDLTPIVPPIWRDLPTFASAWTIRAARVTLETRLARTCKPDFASTYAPASSRAGLRT